MSAAVEVFEVGYLQLRDMLNSGAVGDYMADGESLFVDCYVLVECAGCFDYVQSPRIAHVFSDKAYALKVTEEFVSISNDSSCFAHDYEVWHVVDDFDLWGSWLARVREAKIDAQRKASACRISLDNGYTFLDPVRDDVDLQELIEYLDMYPHIWDTIVSCRMDDETREFTHLTSNYTGMMPNRCMSTAKINAMWLCDYLMNAEQDLIW